MFKTVEQIKNKFIKDGWNKNISFRKLELKEAQEKGYLFAINKINNGKVLFVMNGNNNIYDDNGKILCFGNISMNT